MQDNIDGLEDNGNILVIAATNHYYRLASPLLRAGRFGCIIKLGLLDDDEKLELFNKELSKIGIKLKKGIPFF